MVAGSTENKIVATQTGRHEGRERHRRTGVVLAGCDRNIVISTVIVISWREQVVLYRTPAKFCFSLRNMEEGHGPINYCCSLLCSILLPPLGIFWRFGCGVELLICVILTLLGYLPGVLYALCMIVCIDTEWGPKGKGREKGRRSMSPITVAREPLHTCGSLATEWKVCSRSETGQKCTMIATVAHASHDAIHVHTSTSNISNVWDISMFLVWSLSIVLTCGACAL